MKNKRLEVPTPLSQTTRGKARVPYDILERNPALEISVKSTKLKIKTNQKSQRLFSGC